MSSHDKRFFDGWAQNPDPEDAELISQRTQQWRPISQNPFVHSEPRARRSVAEISEPSEVLQPSEKPGNDRKDSVLNNSNRHDMHILNNPGPAWVHLFYDLAWTATFSSLTHLTSLGYAALDHLTVYGLKLTPLKDTVSYIAFFVVVWWLWASQTLYSVHFYTNDWFHLGSIFLQLVIFGMLAATTRGYDVTTYILRSPGIAELDPKSTDEITDPSRYRAERISKVSMKVIAVSIAASRIILLIQHLRVLIYARYTARKRGHTRVPKKLYIIPTSLVISIPLFVAAWAVSATSYGRTRTGAKLKFIFWGVGLIVEIAAHIQMSRVSWGEFSGNKDVKPRQTPVEVAPIDAAPTLESAGRTKADLPIPRSDVTLLSRLEAITTIILGEGINGIAGTLYAVISAPGLGGPIISNVACSAFIVYFLAYLYFEGPTGSRNPRGKGRRAMYWLLFHLPFLLGIVLLLLGVKNQFLLTSFLSSTESTFQGLDQVFEQEKITLGDSAETNLPIKNYLLRRGISWSEEYKGLMERVTKNNTDPIVGTLNQNQWNEYVAWNRRISLNIIVQLYETFMDGLEQVPKETMDKIEQYRNNLTWPLEDYKFDSDSPAGMHYYTIITELLHSSLQGARYIMALAGLLFICLGILNLLHSRPQDRFQWGIIASRFVMGFLLLCLLLLNVGRYQSLWIWEGQEKQQAGVFLWIWAYWVLPTLAVAFGIQVLVETVLVWLATVRTENPTGGSLWRLAWGSLTDTFFFKPFKKFKKSE